MSPARAQVADAQAAGAAFSYEQAFTRNRGLVSPEEQERLRHKRVIVLGAGGVGGGHALTLARMGVGRLRIVDPDTFSLVNFNRQMGARVSSLGAPKASTTAAMVRDINPSAEVEAIDAPLDSSNVARLFEGVDLVADGLDFYAIDARQVAFAAAEERGIPVVTSGPIGMSATMHVFAPGGMSFSRYFDLRPEMSHLDRLVAFLVGVTPRLSQRPYMDMRFANISEQYGPSLAAACMMCSGVVGVESLRLLLGRPGVRLAPHYYQFDAYRQRFLRGYLLFGNRHPVQLLKRYIVKRTMLRMSPELDKR